MFSIGMCTSSRGHRNRPSTSSFSWVFVSVIIITPSFSRSPPSSPSTPPAWTRILCDTHPFGHVRALVHAFYLTHARPVGRAVARTNGTLILSNTASDKSRCRRKCLHEFHLQGRDFRKLRGPSAMMPETCFPDVARRGKKTR